VLLADHGMQFHGESETVNLSGHLHDAGVDHLFVDAQYLYLR